MRKKLIRWLKNHPECIADIDCNHDCIKLSVITPDAVPEIEEIYSARRDNRRYNTCATVYKKAASETIIYEINVFGAWAVGFDVDLRR